MTRLPLLLLVACGSGDKRDDSASSLDAVQAIVDPERAEHFFDVPFPSDALLGPEGPDLSGFPKVEVEPAGPLVASWVDRIEGAASGFGNNTPAWFRFDGPLSLPESLPGSSDDPVVWIALDGSEQLPLELRFVDDPAGDVFYAPNTLAVQDRLPWV